jgi:hypothetical protein
MLEKKRKCGDYQIFLFVFRMEMKLQNTFWTSRTSKTTYVITLFYSVFVGVCMYRIWHCEMELVFLLT